MSAISPNNNIDSYDLIVIGSGNGACGLLSECLKHAPKENFSILVLEEGQHYYYTGDITHENGWSKTYSSGDIFQPHNTVTSKGRPVLSGRARTMGGGGSINYTMIHESSKWLSENIGHDVDFWNEMKKQLSCKLDRPCPFETKSGFTKFILGKATEKSEEHDPYHDANPKDNFACNIPSLNDDWDSYPTKEAKQLYVFPTQFNQFGQRTNSGVSIVDWADDRIQIRCLEKVMNIQMDESGSTCISVQTSKKGDYKLKSGGKLILCAGAASPRLLMNTKTIVQENNQLGKYVKDHICMPLGIYVVQKKQKDLVGPVDNYGSLFATMNVHVDGKEEPEVVNIDFFTGNVDRLAYLVSSLYLAYLPFNCVKRFVNRRPALYTIISNAIRVLLNVVIFIATIIVGIKDVLTFQGWGASKLIVTTTLVKFNTATDGKYEFKDNNTRITLGFFENDTDTVVAETAIKENLHFLESLGKKSFLISWILNLITKIPYEKRQVSKFVRHFSKRTLLSEQHLAGGCLFGHAIEKGEKNASETGKVLGTKNVHVADLSTVPLPRVSTQMTAYVIGHYVGRQLYSRSK